MSNVNEQFEKIFAFQTEAFEPARAFSGVAAATFEQLARQNYAVFGDYVEFAIDQAKLVGQVKDVKEFTGRQIESNRAFGEKLAGHVNEYVAIARKAQDETQQFTAEAQKAAPARKKAA